jgi:GT2 family glycosyltransferase
MSELTCAISIATHNRLPELRRTLDVIAGLDPAPDELLVCADGCEDGTAQYVREHFPNAKLIEHARPLGSIPSRIELMRASASDIVASLDDDSYPMDSDFIARVRKLFAARPWPPFPSTPMNSPKRWPPRTSARAIMPPISSTPPRHSAGASILN